MTDELLRGPATEADYELMVNSITDCEVVMLDPDGRIVAWSWFFGDGKVGHRRVAKHKYKRPGVYRVTLRTTDSSGNWAFSARKIHVRR